jgi:hypothetical protein
MAERFPEAVTALRVRVFYEERGRTLTALSANPQMPSRCALAFSDKQVANVFLAITDGGFGLVGIMGQDRIHDRRMLSRSEVGRAFAGSVVPVIRIYEIRMLSRDERSHGPN